MKNFAIVACTFLLAACGSSTTPESGKAGDSASGPQMPCVIAATHYNKPAAGADSSLGTFTEPFCEEKIFSDRPDSEIPNRGDASFGQTNPMRLPYGALENCAQRSPEKYYECKPAAGSLALLPDNRLIYFNALESVENSEYDFFYEVGGVTVNDQTRVLQLGANGVASWTRPTPNDGGAHNPTNAPGGGGLDTGNSGSSPDDPADNDGSLFCAHLINLPDGRLLAAGGSDYYNNYGGQAGEVEGIKNTRIFEPSTNRWIQGDPMVWGRWYPSLVTLANGNIFVASGVRKLIGPFYPDRPLDESFRNETHTEVFQPACNSGRGKWTDNREAGRKSLPLYPKLHLLPNGQVYYAGGGIAWSPAGQGYDEATWNMASAWNPATDTWTDLGIAAMGSTFPGFHGSTTNIVLPLVPDAAGHYNKVDLLTMGGTIGTTPGSYVPVAESHVDSVSLSLAGAMTLTSRSVGDLNQRRWFGQAILLPSGEVMLFSGGDLDEVVGPGSEAAIQDTEIYDPATEAWTVMAHQGRPRTYHNTATLLPDGRVLVGGHATHAMAYMVYFDPPTRGPEGHDPTFEIYSPPYVFAKRPVITSVSAASAAPGSTLTIKTPDAKAIAAEGVVTLIHRGAVTHLTDGDQRSVVLKVTGQSGDSLSVRIPSNNGALNEAVAPPGHYMLFIARKDGGKLIPSVSAPLQVTGADAACH